MHNHRSLISCFIAAAFLHGAVGRAATGPAADAGKRNEIRSAEFYLKKFEQNTQRAGGKPFPLRYDDNEALRRVRSLKEQYPDDGQIEEMFQRARRAVMSSKGNMMEITPAMLAYREQETKLVAKLARFAETGWKDYLAELRRYATPLDRVFPAPDPMKCDPDDYIGRSVVLENFHYPANEFTDSNQQYAHVGSGLQGYYFAQLSSRAWLGAYEALKRYRRQVSGELDGEWTVVGVISGAGLLVPQAGEEKTLNAYYGWLVEPRGIYLRGKVFALFRPERDEGGTFAGEDELAAIKGEFYSARAVPDTVEPLQLVEIFATALKEKNWDLYLNCIDPARQKTPTAIDRLRYFYDNNLERYRRFYVYVEPYELESVTAIRGMAARAHSDESFFLSEDQKKKVVAHSEPLVEEAIVKIRTFDEHGKQTSLPKPVTLRRYDRGRWFISGGYPL